MKLHLGFVALLLLNTAAWAQTLSLPAAKKAAELANAQFATGQQNQIIRIEGGKSDSDLRPRQWDITYFDGTRVNNASTIRVKDGVITTISTPLRMFEDGRWSNFDRNFTGYDRAEVINSSRWKLDSPEALKKALADSALANVQVTEVRMMLRKLSDGDVPPVWRVYLRARSRMNPSREAWIGYLTLSAETGEVLRNETRVEKLFR